MPATWIIESKIAEPAPPPGWSRAPLIPAGEPLPPATLLVAGPGYGKTRALAALAAREGAAGAVVAWYGLDAYDADPAAFFHYLVASVRRRLPDFGQDVEAALAGEGCEPRTLWIRFFRALAAYGVPAAIALDDVHHLADDAPELLRGLFAALEGLPAGVRVLLASRRKLALPLARHQASGRLRVIGVERLRFDEAERRAFLQAHADGGVPAAWEAGAATLDGWPLGLELLTHGVDADALNGGSGGAEAVAAYVAEELYLTQPEARRAFMLQAALLTDLGAEACRQAFGRVDAAAHLEALEAELLVERLAGNAGYRFPTYLEEFLRAEAARTIPGPVYESWQRGAAASHLELGRPELALPHLVAIGDWEAALAAGQTCFPAMLATGRQAPIERCLAAVPAEAGAQEPAVALWRGYLAARRGQHQDALPCFERALELYRARGDRAGELKALVRLAGIALISREMPRFGKLAMQAMALLDQGRPEDLADLNLMRALAAESRGDMGLMRECNEAVLAIPVGDDVEVATCRVYALLNLFTAAWHVGDLATARRRIDEAIELAEAWRFRPYHLYASVMRAQLCLTAGDVAGAGALLRALPVGWEDAMDWHDRGCAYAVQGEYLAATGDDRAGEEWLRKANAVFTKAEFLEGMKIPLERLMWTAIRRKQYARARELRREAGAPAEANIYDYALAIADARAAHLAGDHQAALAGWTQLLPALEGLGARLHVARVRLFEAATRLKLGDRAAALAAFTAAEAAIERYDYGFLHESDRGLWDELRPLATPDAGPVAPVAQPGQAAVVDAAPAAPATVPATVPVAAPVAAAEAPPAAQAAPAGQAEPAAQVASATAAASAGGTDGVLDLRLLGAFEVFQGGMRLDQWPRKKARLVLAALALYPRGLPAEQLAELMGEDTRTPAFLASVRVNVMTLRKVLEPALGKREAPRYVLFEHERYMLAPELVLALDWRTFDAAAAEGDRARDKAPDEAAAAYRRALVVYRGNLLEDGGLAAHFEAEREQFRRRAIEALLWLAAHDGRRADLAAEGAALARAAALAPCEEEIYIRLMRHHLAAGRPERVRQSYWDCRKALKARLGIPPSDALEQTFRELAGT